MGRVPTRQEFARLFRQMDLPNRARLSRDVEAGRISDDPHEAGLLAAAARRELGIRRLTPWLAGVLAALSLITVVTTSDPVLRWTSLVVIVLALITAVVNFRRIRPLSETARLNRERAEGPS